MTTEMQQAFTEAYRDFYWKNPESRSGPGSTLDYTRPLRALLPGVLSALGIRTMLDAPCGDFHWMKETDLAGIQYIGGDIVEPMIRDLQARYPDKRFQVLDITTDRLPQVDLWLCRDVLIHLSLRDCFKVLTNFLRSQSRYLATTHFPQCRMNIEVPSSPKSFHQVNLCESPFGLMHPHILLPDSTDPNMPRWLGIWSRDQVAYWFNVTVLIARDGSAMLERQN